MINEATLIGNTGSDPEMFTFDNGDKSARVSLATTKKWKNKDGEPQEKTTWHTIQFGGPLALIVEKYVKKGDRLYISGSIDNYSYQDKEGVTKYASRINCNTMKMLSSKLEGQQQQPQQPQQSQASSAPAEGDDDLPF